MEFSQEQAVPKTTWVDSVPGTIGILLRRYGWLFGVYTAISGAATVLIGFWAYYLPKIMFSFIKDDGPNDFEGMVPDGEIVHNYLGNQMDYSFAKFATNNPVSIMGIVMMIVGVVLIITGVIHLYSD